MSKNEIEECSGKCLNGGVCVNGECACRANFSGELCQNKSKNRVSITYTLEAVKTMTMTYLLICSIILILIGALYYFRAQIQDKIDRILEERRNQNVNPDIDSIIGSNPEPARQGRFGRNTLPQQPSGSRCSI
jgi:hypothetical protein